MATPTASPQAPPTEHGKPELDAAANGEVLTDEEEHAALHFLLGPRTRIEHKVKIQYDTPEGEKPLTFIITARDGRELDKIEQANISEVTGNLDQVTTWCQIVAAATMRIVDETGESIDPKSETFRTVNPEQPPLASPADAIEARFKTQMGLIAGLSGRVRSISGWNPEKVGTVERVLVSPETKLRTAAGN